MKRYILTCSLALIATAATVHAIPAKPGKFIKTMPDGTKVEVELHGDEFCHWMTSGDNIVKQDKNGYLVPSSTYEIKVHMGGGEKVNADRMMNLERTRKWSKPATRASGTNLHFPLILVQFSDLSFTVGDTEEAVYQAFYNLANQEGYSENGANGSIRDFYIDNSLNKLSFYFDVYGPVTVSKSYSYYGTENSNDNEPAPEALYEALQLVYAEQKAAGNSDPFAKYDNDGDGVVDAILMYYAGYNEAEGGDEDTIWPHEWTLNAWDYFESTNYSSTSFGSVTFNTYSCTSEFKGYTDGELCGVGTACHEFGHALGLPDFYDITYNYYSDGYAGGLYEYSTMCSGSYNNDGRTPPYFTVEERMLMGWMSGYETMPTSGEITVSPVNEDFGYKEATSNTNEYFAFECRSGKGWDAYVPAGLVVYHVDKSSNRVTYNNGSSSSTTASALWSSNKQYINASGSHPCYYVVPASDQSNLMFNGGYCSGKMPFPGTGGVTFYQWQGWSSSNKQSDLFYDISFNSSTGKVTMYRGSSHTGLAGVITTTNGDPVPGAKVSLYASYSTATVNKAVSTKSSGPKKISGTVGQPIMSTITGTDGTYSFNLEDLDESTVSLVVNATKYVEKSVTLTPPSSGEILTQNVVIRSVGEPINYTLHQFDLNLQKISMIGAGEANYSLMATAKLSSEELSEYVGRQILGVGFVYASETVSAAYGIVDFAPAGGSSYTRKASVKVDSPEEYVWNISNMISNNIYVEADTDIYFGYALNSPSDSYPILYDYYEVDKGGMYLSTTFSTTSTSSWTDYSDVGNILAFLYLDDTSYLEYNYISDPNLGKYSIGETLALELIEVSGDRKPGTTISWFYDDEPVSDTSITFAKAGYHTIGAKFTTTAGNSKIVELEIVVED